MSSSSRTFYYESPCVKKQQAPKCCVRGPQGPPGVQGPQGAQGAQGEAGTAPPPPAAVTDIEPFGSAVPSAPTVFEAGTVVPPVLFYARCTPPTAEHAPHAIAVTRPGALTRLRVNVSRLSGLTLPVTAVNVGVYVAPAASLNTPIATPLNIVAFAPGTYEATAPTVFVNPGDTVSVGVVVVGAGSLPLPITLTLDFAFTAAIDFALSPL